MTSNGRVIVGCTHGKEDPNRMVVSYTAGAALDQGKQVEMSLSSEGVRYLVAVGSRAGRGG